MIKKMTVIGLSTAMLLSAIPSVYAAGPQADAAVPAVKDGSQPAPANVKITKDNAIKRAKAHIPIPDDYKLQNINYNENSYAAAAGVWSLQFVKNDQRFHSSISVSIDADSGKLVNYYSSDNDPKQAPTYPPKVDLQEAKTLGKTILQKYNAESADKMLYNDEFERSYITPLDGNVRYTIRFDRTENGIRYPSNSTTVTIDGNGNFVAFDTSWDKTVKFDAAAPVLSKANAEKALREKLKPSLTYTLLPGPDKSKGSAPMLAYRLPTFQIDAKTGEPVSGADTTQLKPISDKPLADKPSADKNLTKEQAVAIIADAIGLPEGAKLQDAGYNEYFDETVKDNHGASWYLSWNTGDDKQKADYMSASVNANTGEIANFNRSRGIMIQKSGAEDLKNTITVEQAQAKAIEFLKKVLPHYADQLAFDSQGMKPIPYDKQENMHDVYLNFRRVVTGVPTESDNVNINVNLVTGEIISYWSNLSKVSYPAERPHAIDEKAALAKLLSEYDVELQYSPAGSSAYNPKLMPYPPTPGEPGEQTAKLVYQLMPKSAADYQLVLDATTGEWKSRETGAVTAPGKIAAADLEGHWAQKELQLMIDYKAIDVKDGKVEPDKLITRGEMIKMLVIAMNGGYYGPMYAKEQRAASFKDVAGSSAYFSFVEYALDNNLIDKTSDTFNPEGTMTRDELAQLIVRALGYDKLAEHAALFSLRAADADQIKHKGQAAIVLELGIMTMNNGNFSPAAGVSRADAATVFYRYLSNRSLLKDVRIY